MLTSDSASKRDNGGNELDRHRFDPNSNYWEKNSPHPSRLSFPFCFSKVFVPLTSSLSTRIGFGAIQRECRDMKKDVTSARRAQKKRNSNLICVLFSSAGKISSEPRQRIDFEFREEEKQREREE